MDEPASYLLAFSLIDAPAESAMGITLKILAILVLVLVNGFFVAAEFALVGVRRSRIETLAESGNRRARRLLGILNNLNAYLSASQLGITLASLALGMLGEPTIARLLERPLSGLSPVWQHTIALIIAYIIITILHIVLGEQAPKLYGLDRADKVALATAWPMEMFYKIFRLPIHALDWASARVVRPFGVHATAEHASIYTETELRQLVDIAHQSGHLRPAEKRLIHRVFEFSDTLVREAMVPRTEMAAISVDCSLEEIADAFRKHGHSRLPVYRESLDDIVGFINSKDVMPYLLHPDTFRLESVLQAPLYVVDTARLEDVLKQMQEAKVHFGFIVDEHGGVEGIITLEDLLEEIVGDLSDRHNVEVDDQIIEDGDGIYKLDGGLAVRDLNRRLKLSVPESEAYTTIAGFLMTAAGHVLEPGEIVQHDGLKFRVERVERRRVVSVRLEKNEEHALASGETSGNGDSASG